MQQRGREVLSEHAAQRIQAEWTVAYHAKGDYTVSYEFAPWIAQRLPDSDVPEYEDTLQNIEDRVFHKFRIHLVDTNAGFQKLDVVWQEHNAQEDHINGRQSELTINNVVATKRWMRGHLLCVLQL
jgi:hypothetical protein